MCRKISNDTTKIESRNTLFNIRQTIVIFGMSKHDPMDALPSSKIEIPCGRANSRASNPAVREVPQSDQANSLGLEA